MKPLLIIIILAIVTLFSCNHEKYPDSLSPEQALKAFTIDDNFEIQVFAAEPFVKDPVSMAFDENGIAYVVEMPDYPYPPEPGKEAGRIVVLLDKNHDNKIDTSIVFADKLSEATSILPWNGGLIVTAAPNILFLKDTTGDFKADIKQVLFSGFFKGNSEAQITSLRFGVDNWVYAANYGQDSKVRPDEKNTDSATWLSLSGGDFRFRLDKNTFEAVAGSAQFGQSFDDWNHRFLTENSHHLRQAVIPWKYLHRNPYIPPTDAVSDITDHGQKVFQVSKSPYWRIVRTRNRNADFKAKGLDRVEYEREMFTGASGGIFYGGDLFPSEYYGNYFVTEVACNLVHRDIMKEPDSSVLFIASRSKKEENKEFLTSTDMWFRPTNIIYGPDGALYLTDMYRQHIETPFAISEELKKDMNYDNGKDKGRIYRIVPKNKITGNEKAAINNNMKISDWVQLLSHPNQFWAMEAHKKLMLLHDKSAVPLLVNLFETGSNGRARLHALYLLDGLNAITAPIVQKAISDKNPGIREAGIQLGENVKACQQLILERINDSSKAVMLQAVLSAGNFGNENLYPGFKKVLLNNGNDKWIRLAILTSNAGSSIPFFKSLLNDSAFFSGQSNGYLFAKEFASVIARRNKVSEVSELLKLLSAINTPGKQTLQMNILGGLKNGIEDLENPQKPENSVILELDKIGGSSNEEVKKLVKELKEVYK